MKHILRSDIIVIGGGIVGTTITKQLALKYPTKIIKLIEKDSNLGTHNSILNSGVIHAGIYYPNGSNRAKYCVKGNKLLSDFHLDKKIKLNNCGKLILATNQEEYITCQSLYQQGIKNGVNCKFINYNEAIKIEPNLRNYDFPILFSPDTKIGNPKKVIEELNSELEQIYNVKKSLNVGFKNLIKLDDTEIIFEDTNGNFHNCNYLINAAGLYSDKIAKQFNIGLNFEILPISGTYLIDKNHNNKLNTLIYPVPPKQASKGNNFLGVHTTITQDGMIKLGPTALPCLWREQHLGLVSFNFEEFYQILKLYSKLLYSHKRYFYFDLLLTQLKNQNSKNVLKEGKNLIKTYDDDLINNFVNKQGGVRSQIINLDNFELENDFIILKNNNHIHIMNMISPGWTSAMAIAEDINFD